MFPVPAVEAKQGLCEKFKNQSSVRDLQEVMFDQLPAYFWHMSKKLKIHRRKTQYLSYCAQLLQLTSKAYLPAAALSNQFHNHKHNYT